MDSKLDKSGGTKQPKTNPQQAGSGLVLCRASVRLNFNCYGLEKKAL